MFDEKLLVRTHSLATAGAIMALTDAVPTLTVRDGKVMYTFPPETEGALQKYLRAKQYLDRANAQALPDGRSA